MPNYSTCIIRWMINCCFNGVFSRCPIAYIFRFGDYVTYDVRAGVAWTSFDLYACAEHQTPSQNPRNPDCPKCSWLLLDGPPKHKQNPPYDLIELHVTRVVYRWGTWHLRKPGCVGHFPVRASLAVQECVEQDETDVAFEEVESTFAQSQCLTLVCLLLHLKYAAVYRLIYAYELLSWFMFVALKIFAVINVCNLCGLVRFRITVFSQTSRKRPL